MNTHRLLRAEPKGKAIGSISDPNDANYGQWQDAYDAQYDADYSAWVGVTLTDAPPVDPHASWGRGHSMDSASYKALQQAKEQSKAQSRAADAVRRGKPALPTLETIFEEGQG